LFGACFELFFLKVGHLATVIQVAQLGIDLKTFIANYIDIVTKTKNTDSTEFSSQHMREGPCTV
jgi:hypothetical protein